MTIRQPGRPLFGEAGFQRFSSLLGNMMIRTTAQATLSAALRKVDSISVHGATVRATTPGGQYATVHIDGDAPGQTTQVPLATWEYFEVGQRVVVMLFPPSGALVIGYTGRPPGWTQYPSDFSPWYSANRKTPTITEHGEAADFPGSVSGWTSSSFSPAANRLIVVVSNTLEMSSDEYTTVTGITNTGVPLLWTRAASRYDTYTSGSAYSPYKFNQEIWWAYNASAQTGITITAAWDRSIIPVPRSYSVMSIADAMAIQTEGSTQSSQVGSNVVTHNHVTNIDHSAIVAAVLYHEYTGGALNNLDPSPAASNTMVVDYPSFTAAEWRASAITRRTTTTAGSYTVGGTMTGSFASEREGSILSWEIVGVPDVPVIGDGALRAAYRLDGTSLELRLGVAAGSTTTFGGGPHAFRLPPGMVAAALPSGAPQQISGIVIPAGTNRYRAIAEITAGASYFDKIIYQDASTTYLSSTAPVAMTSAMKMGLGGVIEVAPG